MTTISFPTIEQPRTYLREVIRYSGFWLSLARVDLRNRFRRTLLGIAWVVVQPFMFTLVLSLVFHFLFNQSFVNYSVYVFSGLILWTWFSEAFLLGANSVLQAQAFIRQKRLPLVIYGLRTFLVATVTFLISFLGLLAWFFLTGHRPGAWALLLPVNIVFIAVWLFPVVVFSGVIGVLYRDYQQFTQIVLQALWFLSPVFMDKTVFLRPGIRVWDHFNPVANMLALIRRPLTENQPPGWENYLYTAAFGVAAWMLALHLLKRHEKRLVYYL